MLRPPRRLRVSEAAERYVRISAPGGYAGPWSARETPYMVRPMDCLNSRALEAVIFVGPARSGKTQGLLDSWLGYIVQCDPGDTLFVHMSQDMARDFSMRRVDRLHEGSPDIGQHIRIGSQEDNTYDKIYKHGMILSIAWPSTTQLAARDIRYVGLSDYDGMPQQIGREGSPFALAQKRNQTFMSSGMCMAESSPRHDWPELDWVPSTPHELPYAQGICTLFNRGTREVLYFQCFECREWFIPDFPEAFTWEESDDVEVCAHSTRYVCPHCGSLFEEHKKLEFLAGCRWVPDGCTLNEHGELEGDVPRSTIASFRLPAGAAAFQRPSELTRRWVRALHEYARTGDETSLRSTVTVDQGKPYRPRLSTTKRVAAVLKDRAEPSNAKIVPNGVRFLTAAVDVQGRKFAVLVIGWGVGLERWVIDRFDLEWSPRRDERGDPVRVRPAQYIEDWEILFDRVISAQYPVADGSGRVMRMKVTAGDSGGEDGVTDRSYEFWLRAKKRGLDKRFWLIKGASSRNAPRIRRTFPDAERKDRRSIANGEVPVFLLNTDQIKDGLANDLDREEPGPGYVHFPSYLSDSFYDELVAEVRDPRKGWEKTSKRLANESWDLMVYNRAITIALGVERINWDSPPAWALPWDQNPLVVGGGGGDSTPPTNAPQRPRRPRVRVINSGIR